MFTTFIMLGMRSTLIDFAYLQIVAPPKYRTCLMTAVKEPWVLHGASAELYSSNFLLECIKQTQQ